MVTHEYKCTNKDCKHEYEVFEKMDAPLFQGCEKCGGLARRAILTAPAGIVRNGSRNSSRPNTKIANNFYELGTIGKISPEERTQIENYPPEFKSEVDRIQGEAGTNYSIITNIPTKEGIVREIMPIPTEIGAVLQKGIEKKIAESN